MTWWRGPLDHLHGRMETNVFDFEGIVGFGYVLFALGLALAVGAVWRRTVPALIVGFAGYTAARIFVQGWLRERYEAPLTSVAPQAARPARTCTRAWVLVGACQATERATSSQNPASTPSSRVHARSTATTRSLSPSCLVPHGAGYNHAVYQPASRFWLFQGIETALFGATALALILFAAWWVHERTS